MGPRHHVSRADEPAGQARLLPDNVRTPAAVAELVDAQASGACALRGVEVQVLSAAYPGPGGRADGGRRAISSQVLASPTSRTPGVRAAPGRRVSDLPKPHHPCLTECRHRDSFRYLPGKDATIGGGRSRPLSQREREIFELRASGWTLREIGERYGISRQRVDEIVRDRGGPQLDEVIAARRARQTEVIDARSDEIRAWWRDGEAIETIAERLDLPVACVQRSIGQVLDPLDRAHRNRAIVTRTRSRRYADEELLDGIRAVARQVGRAPTQEEYRSQTHELGLASILTLAKRFGGWQQSLVEAGLTPLPRARTVATRRKWDRGRVLAGARGGGRPARRPAAVSDLRDDLHGPRRPALRPDGAQPARPLDRHRDRARRAAVRSPPGRLSHRPVGRATASRCARRS